MVGCKLLQALEMESCFVGCFVLHFYSSSSEFSPESLPTWSLGRAGSSGQMCTVHPIAASRRVGEPLNACDSKTDTLVTFFYPPFPLLHSHTL